MRVRLLGPFEVEHDGAEVSLRSPSQRVVLAVLASRAGRVVPAGELIEAVWPDQLPGQPTTALQIQVSRLRKLLPAGLVSTVEPGYRLDLPGPDVDAVEFEGLVAHARRHLEAGSVADALAALRRADLLWRGDPFTDLPETAALVDAAAGLRRSRLWVLEQLASCRIEVDDDLPELVSRLEALVAENPLHERFTELLMQALYRTGRQADALAQGRRIRAQLREELGVRPSPDLADVELAILTHDPRLGSSGRAASDEPEAPPASLTSFVGRAADRQRLLDAVAGHRLVTVTGPGGAGKTRLVSELFDELDDLHPDRAWFVPLADVDLAGAVPSAVARALGVETGGRDDATAKVVRRFVDRRSLVVVDNCEQVLDATAEVVDALLSRCRGLRVLVTSREPLRLQGEHVVPISGLQLGGDGTGDAETLFAVRSADRGVGPPDPEVVATLCRLVEGWPLAIELLAANATDLDRAAGAHIEDLILGYATPYRNVPDRQASLRATLDWSSALLDDDLRRGYAALGVFDGPVEPGGAQHVLGVLGLGADGVTAGLVERSLAGQGADGLTTMLRPVTQHARASLAALGPEAGAVHVAFVEYVRSFAEALDNGLDSSEAPSWLERLWRQEPNVVRAVPVALAEGMVTDAVSIVTRTGYAWMVGDRHPVGLSLLERLRTHPSAAGLPWTARRDLGQTAGYLLGSSGRYRESSDELEAVLDLQGRHDDPARVTTIGNLSNVMEQELRLEPALERLSAAVLLLAEYGREAGADRALSNRSSLEAKRSSVLWCLGRYEESAGAADEAVAAAERLDAAHLRLSGLGAGVEAHLGAGRVETASALLDEMTALSGRLDGFRASLIHRDRALVSLTTGDVDRAEGSIRRGMQDAPAHDTYELAWNLAVLAPVQLAADDVHGARASLVRGLRVVVDDGAGVLAPILLSEVAELLAALGIDEESHEAAEAVARLCGASGFVVPRWATGDSILPVVRADTTVDPIAAARNGLDLLSTWT